MVASTALEPNPNSVRQAREFYASTTHRLGLAPDLVELGSLAVSELVTNAICHGDGPIEIRTMLDRATVRFEVSDRSPDMPQERAQSPMAVSGRGLGIVERVAETWGCDRHRDGHGKTMWFTLPRGE